MIPYPPLGSHELAEVLRPAPEPMRHVSDALVHSIVLADPLAYVDFLEQGIRDIASGRVALTLPEKAVFEDGPAQGDFRVMPCITRFKDRIVKTVKVVGTNLAQREVSDQVTVGKALLLHPVENYVTHLFDANALSSIRTGACVALAIRLLNPGQRRMLFIGAGRVGFYSAIFAAAQGGVEAMHFSDRESRRARALAAVLAARHQAVRFSHGAVSAQHAADTVVLATTASKPLCHPPGWGAQLIVSVGADTDYQHELAPAWADCAHVCVDTRDTARFGDLRQWLQEGRIRGEDLRDLFDVLRGRPAATRPVLFVSTGSALFDNLTMAYLVERLPEAGQSPVTKS